MNIEPTPIFTAFAQWAWGVFLVVLPVVVGAYGAKLVAQTKAVIDQAKQNLNEGELAFLRTVARTVVSAVEQLWQSGQIEAAKRKDEAVKQIDAYLRSRGIVAPLAEIEMAIEAEVLEVSTELGNALNFLLEDDDDDPDSVPEM